MNGRPLTPGIILLASLAFVAVALALVATPANASVTGVQPPASGDWVIDQDTTVLAESLITLKGDIIVESGYMFTVRNSVITFDCTYAGEYGFYVLTDVGGDGDMDLSQSTFQSKADNLGWYLEIYGAANIHDSVKLHGVQDGIQIFGDDVNINETEATTLGPYGIVVDSCDPTLGPDLEISVTHDTNGWNSLFRESVPTPGMAIAIVGSSGDMASPNIDGVTIDLWMRDAWLGTVSTSTSCYERLYIYGIYASYADLDSIKNLSISLDYEVSANITYTYSSPYLYFYNYQYVYGVYLVDGTYLDDFENVLIYNSSGHTDAWQTGASTSYFRNYQYVYAVYNTISSMGSSPSSWGGVAFRGYENTYDTHDQFSSVYNYPNGYGVHWYPSSSATSSRDMVFDNIAIDGIGMSRPFNYPQTGKITIKDCEVSNCVISSQFFYLYRCPYDVTMQGTLIYNNTMNTYFAYVYYNNVQITFEGNNFTMNTFRSYFIYNYQGSSSYQGDILLKDNVFMDNTHSSYFIYSNYQYGEIEFNGNVFGDNQYNSYYIYSNYQYGEIEFNGNVFGDNQYNSYYIYSYYAYGDWLFEDNVYFKNTYNTHFIYAYYSRCDWNFVGNNYTSNAFRTYFLYDYYLYDGDLTLKDNLFDGNTHSSYMVYYYGNMANNNCDLVWDGNHIVNNTYSSYMGYCYYVRGDFIFTNNVVEKNKYTNYIIYLYGYYLTGTFDFSGNRIEGNKLGTTYGFYLYYLGYYSDDLTFERNEIINNTGGASYEYYAVVQLYYIRKGLTISHNYIAENRMTAICVYYAYGNMGNPPIYDLIIEYNEIVDNHAKGIMIYRMYWPYDVYIRYNTGTGNENYAIAMDVDSYSYRGPRLLSVEANDFQYNPGGGMYLRPYFFNPQSVTDYRAPNQQIQIKKNNLMNNGAGGWALAVVDFHRFPIMKNNNLTGSAKGQYLEITANQATRANNHMILRDMSWDGGVNGTTALGFGEINVEFYDCTWVNYTEALFAKDCQLTVWYCSIPEASGATEGNGRIHVWNNLEIWVTWANATGVDSGHPAPGALIAMRGANGKYLGAQFADDEGKLEPMLLNPWTCINGVMDAWSPFTMTIMANDISTPHVVSVIGEALAPDAKELTVNDIFIPEVIISNPQDDTLVKTADVLTEGFLFEVGSGINTFEGHSDVMGEDEWQPINETVLWQYVFLGMTEGAHNLSVRAADLSGNWNTSSIKILVDLTKPDLEVVLEYLNTTRIPYNETMGGYFVRDREIAINGTYDDNFATLGEIVIRINGVPEYIFPSQWGTIYKRIKLDQGINTIIVDSTDTAGNRATITLYVTLDSYAPTMYIYNPLDGERTPDKVMTIVGLTEPSTALEFVVQSSVGQNIYRSTSDDTGAFAYDVELFEGIQKILVTATDSAGNPTLLFRDVTLDTTPPDFVINSPPGEHAITNKVRYTIVATMTAEPDAEVWIGGQRVDHKGVPQREVVLQEGENVIEIKAIDKVGNEKVSFVTIVRDTVPPVLTVTTPEGDYLITNMTTIHFSGLVGGSAGVDIIHKSIHFPATLMEGDWDTGGVWAYDLELGPQDLEQDIEVVAYDPAENEAIHIVGIRLDIVPPSLHIDAVPSEVTTAFIWINGTTDAGIPTVLVQSQEYPVANGVFTIQWSLVAGENRITVTVQDEAGNTQRDIVTTTYDYTPPVPPTTTEPTEGLSISTTFGIAILLMAIVILVVVLFVTRQRGRR